MSKAKILLLDIETAPHLAYVWRTFKENITPSQMVKRTTMLSYAAKWLDHDEIVADWTRDINDPYHEVRMLHGLRMLLDSADIVVAHNGMRFDIPVINGRFLVHGIEPPSPFHQVDTFQVAKREFRFASNSLASIAEELGLSPKSQHKEYPGFELWKACLANDHKAWLELIKYNKQDVVVLEEVYLRMRPYMRSHPNVVHFEDGLACPKCGSNHIQMRGYYTSPAGLHYHRFQCQSCGGWGRHRLSDRSVDKPEGRNAR